MINYTGFSDTILQYIIYILYRMFPTPSQDSFHRYLSSFTFFYTPPHVPCVFKHRNLSIIVLIPFPQPRRTWYLTMNSGCSSQSSVGLHQMGCFPHMCLLVSLQDNSWSSGCPFFVYLHLIWAQCLCCSRNNLSLSGFQLRC